MKGVKFSSIKPRFEVGDKVWVANAEHIEGNKKQCSDCQGSGTWTVTIPAGDSFSVCCATCDPGFGRIGYGKKRGLGRGTVSTTTAVSKPNSATIGGIQVDTDGDHPIRYTMRGGYRHFSESEVFMNEEDALKAGEPEAEKLRQEIAKRARQTDQMRAWYEGQIRHPELKKTAWRVWNTRERSHGEREEAMAALGRCLTGGKSKKATVETAHR